MHFVTISANTKDLTDALAAALALRQRTESAATVTTVTRTWQEGVYLVVFSA